MHDKYKNTVKVGDTLIQTIGDSNLPAGAKWQVLDFGIEPSTKNKICIIKDATKGYIMAAYQCELNYFKKEVKTND